MKYKLEMGGTTASLIPLCESDLEGIPAPTIRFHSAMDGEHNFDNCNDLCICIEVIASCIVNLGMFPKEGDFVGDDLWVVDKMWWGGNELNKTLGIYLGIRYD